MRSNWLVASAAAAMLAGLLTPVIAQQNAQSKTADGDWPHFNRDERSSRYSPLKQITAANVAQLQQAWTYTPRRGDPPPPHRQDSVGSEAGASAMKSCPLSSTA